MRRQYSDVPPVARRRSALIFVAILLVASTASLLIVVSPYVYVSHDPGALSLSASLNSTSVMLNQTVRVTVSERSALRIPDELSLAGRWAVQNMSMGPCASASAYPFGVAVLQGRYTAENVSVAKALLIFAPGAYYCGAAFPSDSITFKPKQAATSYVDLRGYWTQGYTTHSGGGLSEGVLHPFAPGEYTVVAGDEWGRADLLYFRVGAEGISLKDIVLCPAVCGYPLRGLSGTVYFEAPSPLRSLEVYINGTDQGLTTYDNPGLASIDLATQYNPGLQSPPLVAHDKYVMRFVLAFADNSTVTATETLVGG